MDPASVYRMLVMVSSIFCILQPGKVNLHPWELGFSRLQQILALSLMRVATRSNLLSFIPSPLHRTAPGTWQVLYEYFAWANEWKTE